MVRYRNPRVARILPVIFIAVIVILAVTALVSLAQGLISSSRSSSSETVNVAREALLSTNPDHRVRMVVRGPIVADEQFNSYRIDVSPNNRSLTTFEGYLDRVVEQENLGNNTAAYEAFVFALDRADFTNGRELDEDANDTRGVCATGNVYEFFIIEGDRTVERLWTTTCRGIDGSLRSNVDSVERLFTDQIPESRDMIRDVDL